MTISDTIVRGFFVPSDVPTYTSSERLTPVCVRVDIRRDGSGYLLSYAPITVDAEGRCHVVASGTFEDIREEMIPCG